MIYDCIGGASPTLLCGLGALARAIDDLGGGGALWIDD